MTPRDLRFSLATLALIACGCATPAPPVEPTQPIDPFGHPRIPASAAAPGAAGGTPDASALPTRTTELERPQVDAFQANGPSWFIRQVAMEPARLGDKFVGFRILHFFEGDPRFSAVDLRPGDVVLRINGMPIGKPDQFMKAWEDIKVAQKLVVEYVRGGSIRVLEWDIVDDSAIQPQIVTGGG